MECLKNSTTLSKNSICLCTHNNVGKWEIEKFDWRIFREINFGRIFAKLLISRKFCKRMMKNALFYFNLEIFREIDLQYDLSAKCKIWFDGSFPRRVKLRKFLTFTKYFANFFVSHSQSVWKNEKFTFTIFKSLIDCAWKDSNA